MEEPLSDQDKLCFVCQKNNFKYVCPACKRRTCCVECSKKHKEMTGCTGKKTRSEFIGLSDMNDNTMMEDYKFLMSQQELIADSRFLFSRVAKPKFVIEMQKKNKKLKQNRHTQNDTNSNTVKNELTSEDNVHPSQPNTTKESEQKSDAVNQTDIEKKELPTDEKNNISILDPSCDPKIEIKQHPEPFNNSNKDNKSRNQRNKFAQKGKKFHNSFNSQEILNSLDELESELPDLTPATINLNSYLALSETKDSLSLHQSELSSSSLLQTKNTSSALSYPEVNSPLSSAILDSSTETLHTKESSSDEQLQKPELSSAADNSSDSTETKTNEFLPSDSPSSSSPSAVSYPTSASAENTLLQMSALSQMQNQLFLQSAMMFPQMPIAYPMFPYMAQNPAQ